jgi:hypothetical protein
MSVVRSELDIYTTSEHVGGVKTAKQKHRLTITNSAVSLLAYALSIPSR